jgi:alpha-N-arabinofuranosidase
MKKRLTFIWIAFGICLLCVSRSVVLASAGSESQTPVLQIKADQVTAKVSPMLYGLMTEEINFCYDGGLYAELIRNRIFKEIPIRRRRRGQSEDESDSLRIDGLIYWNLVQSSGGAASMAQDTTQPMNKALTNSLKLEVTSAGENQRVGISNDGFWGIPVRPNTQYKARIHAKGGNGFTGPLTLAIVSNDGKTVYAKAQIPTITQDYQKYETTLTTGNVTTTKDALFHIWAGDTGTVWFSLVSLFPPTYNNRPNGLRPDIMKLLIDMKPAFLRFPGGNYLEGRVIETRFYWKKTIGDISERPGHPCDAWGYWSSDGMGLLEFLIWCEDMDAEPVVGVYAGYSLSRVWIEPGPDLEPFVQDALDEIEYIIGDTSTKWGARRAKDGHPEPFKLTYVEIGNEENLGGNNRYNERFAQFYDAIKAKYPQLKIIAATPYPRAPREAPEGGGFNRGRVNRGLTSRKPDVYDDHFYWRSLSQARLDTERYDNFDRNGPKVFVGEWATRVGNPTPNMGAALSDAAWMTGMERNSDVVIMEAYAPLFVNVNPGAMQWTTDLIGFDTLTSYGSPGYYAQQIFSTNHGNTVVAATLENVPSQQMEQSRRRFRRGGGGEQSQPQMIDVPSLSCNATRDSDSGIVYVKVVNAADRPQPVHIKISGMSEIEPAGEIVEMKGENNEDTNSITDPKNIVPVTKKIDGLSKDFTRTFPSFSISVLKLKGK